MPEYAAIVGDHILQSYPPVDEGRMFDPTIHVSNLIDFCPKEFYLCRENGRSYHQRMYLGVRTGWDFDLGHAIQRIQAERLSLRGVLYGTWKCLHCGSLELRYYRKAVRCTSCRARAFTPVDTTLVREIGVICVVGNVDLFPIIRLNPPKLAVCDSKSIKAEDFDKLTGPHTSYRRQVQLYMDLIARGAKTLPHVRVIDPMPEVCTETAVIAYASKGSRPMPFKQFDVHQDPEFIAKVEEKLQSLSIHVLEGTCPPQQCGSMYDMMAKKCAVRDICFGYQQGQEPTPAPLVEIVTAPQAEDLTFPDHPVTPTRDAKFTRTRRVLKGKK